MTNLLPAQQINALIRQGLDCFNKEEFFEAHELLETAWRSDSSPRKTLVQGLIQFSVGCYHADRKNWKGAITVLLRAKKNLLPYQGILRPVDVAQIIAQIDQLLKEVNRVQHSGETAEILCFPRITLLEPPDKP